MTTTQNSQLYQQIADVLRTERGECSMQAHRQMLNRVTRALADLFTELDPGFDGQQFRRDSGMPAAIRPITAADIRADILQHASHQHDRHGRCMQEPKS